MMEGQVVLRRKKGLQLLLHHQFRLQLPLRAAYYGTEVWTNTVGWPRMPKQLPRHITRLHGDSRSCHTMMLGEVLKQLHTTHTQHETTWKSKEGITMSQLEGGASPLAQQLACVYGGSPWPKWFEEVK